MKNIIIVLVVIVAGVLIWYWVGNNKASTGPVMCTQEAKQCPDGSYVSRTGPNCEFTACPGIPQ